MNNTRNKSGAQPLSDTEKTITLKLSLTERQYSFITVYGRYSGKTKRQQYIRDLIDAKIKTINL